MGLPGPLANHQAEFDKYIPTGPFGALAEFGVFNGGASRQLAKYGRTVYAFDTFEGMPSVGHVAELDSGNPPGKFKPEVPLVDMFKDYPNIRPVVGRFDITLPFMSPDICFAFAYIDCDNYQGHKDVLNFLNNRMMRGGVILLDDPDLAGAAKAIKEFTNTNPWWQRPANNILRQDPIDYKAKLAALAKLIDEMRMP